MRPEDLPDTPVLTRPPSIGAQEIAVPRTRASVEAVHLHLGLQAQGANDHVLVGKGVEVFRSEGLGSMRSLARVVLGQLLDLAVSVAVGAAVADEGDINPDQERQRHERSAQIQGGLRAAWLKMVSLAGDGVP